MPDQRNESSAASTPPALRTLEFRTSAEVSLVRVLLRRCIRRLDTSAFSRNVARGLLEALEGTDA